MASMEDTAPPAGTHKREGEALTEGEQPPSKQQKQAMDGKQEPAATMVEAGADSDEAVAAPSGPAGGDGGEGGRQWMVAPAQPMAVRIGACQRPVEWATVSSFSHTATTQRTQATTSKRPFRRRSGPMGTEGRAPASSMTDRWIWTRMGWAPGRGCTSERRETGRERSRQRG